MRSSSGSKRRTSSGSSGNLGTVASKARQSWESGSSALDLAELLEKKELSAAEVVVIRQSMVQVCDASVLACFRRIISCGQPFAPVGDGCMAMGFSISRALTKSVVAFTSSKISCTNLSQLSSLRLTCVRREGGGGRRSCFGRHYGAVDRRTRI